MKGYTGTCSKACANKQPHRRAQTAQMMADRGKEILAKSAETMLKRYGVKYSGQSRKLLRKTHNTMKLRYGKAHPLQNKVSMTKAINTNLEKYGATNPMQNRDIRAKVSATTLDRYGVEHILQSRDFHSNRTYQFKIIKLKGKTFKVQGYEPQAIEYLHKCLNVPVDAIQVGSEVPSIPYTYKGKSHVYHPDMRVKIKGKWYLLEVKSTYTAGLKHRTLWYNLKRKLGACSELGYRPALIVIGSDGSLFMSTNPLELTPKQVSLHLQANP